MISAIDSDKMDTLCRRMLNNTVKNGLGLEKKTGHILAIDKHLIPFTGAGTMTTLQSVASPRAEHPGLRRTPQCRQSQKNGCLQ